MDLNSCIRSKKTMYKLEKKTTYSTRVTLQTSLGDVLLCIIMRFFIKLRWENIAK